MRKHETRAPGIEAQEAESIWIRAGVGEKKEEDDIGVQNPLAGPGGEPRFSIDARSFIPERAFVLVRMNERSALPLFPLSFYPLRCYLNSPVPNFHVRHASEKLSNLQAIYHCPKTLNLDSHNFLDLIQAK